MKFKIKEESNIIRVDVDGPIEMETIKELKFRLLKLDQVTDKDIEINLSKVDYIDSTGITLLITLSKQQKQKGKSIKLTEPTPRVSSLLEISSLSGVLE